jgi:hypothetical protein
MYKKNLTSNSDFIFETVLTDYYFIHGVKLEPWTTAIKVYDKSSGDYLDTIPYSASDINSIWADDSYLYIGTTTSGINRLPMSIISNPSISGIGLVTYIQEYKKYPNITSNNINYIHGNNNYLCVATISGIDHININTDDRYYTTLSGRIGFKCHQTSTGRFYYIDAISIPIILGMVVTIDHTKIEGTLSNFPVCITLTASNIHEDFLNGITGSDWQYLYAKVNNVDCYIEVDQFDITTPKIILWVKVPTVSSSVDTKIVLTFNTSVVNTYIGLTGSTAAKNVWDSNFMAVYHMSQTPVAGTPCILDSTTNANHGIPTGTLSLVDSGSGKALNFTGGQYITSINNSGISGNAARTTEGYAASSTTSYTTARCVVGIGNSAAVNYTWFFLSINTSGNWFLNIYNADLSSGVGAVQNQLTNVCARWTPTTASIFVNNNKYTRTITSLNTTASKIRIGETTYGTNHNRWIGTISEVRVSNIARSDAWLRATNYTLKDTLCSYESTEILVPNDMVLNTVYNNTSNWNEATVGYKYESTDDFIPISFVPYDIDVSENTSLYDPNDNVIFLATDSGALIIEERQGDELNSRFKYYLKDI